MKDFFGREELISSLKSLWNKRVPSLVTCRGRRRVGKSTLIAEFARRAGARLIKLEGLRPKEKMTNVDQLKYFISQLSLQTNCDESPVADSVLHHSSNCRLIQPIDTVAWKLREGHPLWWGWRGFSKSLS